MEETQIDVMNLEAGILTINEIRIERGLETVPWGDTPLNYNSYGEINTLEEEPDTGDTEVDKALALINDTRAKFYRSYAYGLE